MVGGFGGTCVSVLLQHGLYRATYSFVRSFLLDRNQRRWRCLPLFSSGRYAGDAFLIFLSSDIFRLCRALPSYHHTHARTPRCYYRTCRERTGLGFFRTPRKDSPLHDTMPIPSFCPMETLFSLHLFSRQSAWHARGFSTCINRCRAHGT